MNLTVTISVIVALASVIAPMLTSIINNRYQLKLKKLELEEHGRADITLHKREIFERYLQSAGTYINSECYLESDMKTYGSCYQQALFCAPEQLQEDMIALHSIIHETPYSAQDLLDKITIALSRQFESV